MFGPWVLRMDHRDIISKLKKYKIPHGPITESTKKLYLKKIQSFEQHTCNEQLNEPSNLEQILKKVKEFEREDFRNLPNEEFNLLMKYFKMKNSPLNPASRKLISKQIYLKIHDLEEMDWDPIEF
jgi:hypothetical protein